MKNITIKYVYFSVTYIIELKDWSTHDPNFIDQLIKIYIIKSIITSELP